MPWEKFGLVLAKLRKRRMLVTVVLSRSMHGDSNSGAALWHSEEWAACPGLNSLISWWAVSRKYSCQFFIFTINLRTHRIMFSFTDKQSPGNQGSRLISRKESVASISPCATSTILLPSHQAQLWGESQVLGALTEGTSSASSSS